MSRGKLVQDTEKKEAELSVCKLEVLWLARGLQKKRHTKICIVLQAIQQHQNRFDIFKNDVHMLLGSELHQNKISIYSGHWLWLDDFCETIALYRFP